MTWQPIETAPKDGTTIRAKRMIKRRVVWQGKTFWGQLILSALFDPITIEKFADAQSIDCWRYLDVPARVPEPTHWKPPE